MRSIASDIQNNILSALNQGHSTRQVAQSCNVSKSTVQRLRQKFLPDLQIPKHGRIKKLSTRNVNFLVRSMTSGKIETATEAAQLLKQDVGVDVSYRTVARDLNAVGLHAAEKSKKPKLSTKNIRSRLQFATKYKDWTAHDWKRVIWSDETKINRFGSDGRAWYWKREGERVQPHHVQQVVKHGGGSLMIWGCITWDGPGFMCRIDGRMDQHLYKAILNDELRQTIEYYALDHARVIFQHDNDSKHTAKKVREWLDNQPFSVINDWPAQSPDLNPIEHIWAHLKRRLNQYDAPPSGMNALWERLENEWNQITKETCQNLIESMPQRLQAVLKAKGKWTRY